MKTLSMYFTRTGKLSIVFSWFLLATMSGVIQGCSEPEKDDQSATEQVQPWQSLEQEVMDIHDEVMPRMPELNNLQKRLETMAANDSSNELIITAISDLRKADSLMWAWMYQYKRPEGDDTEAILKYLEGEKVKVTAVKEAMISSMDNARQIIKPESDE